MDKSSIASRLRSERIRIGLTQSEMADRMELPHVTYRSYESGRSMPPLSFYERLLSAQLDASYVASGRPTFFGVSEHGGTLDRKRKKQPILANQPATIAEALLLLNKLVKQAENDAPTRETRIGKAGQ